MNLSASLSAAVPPGWGVGKDPRRPLGAALCALAATVVLASCGGGPSPEDAEAYVTEQLEAEGGEVRSVLCDEDNSGTRYECNVEFANEVIDERAGGLTVVEKDEID